MIRENRYIAYSAILFMVLEMFLTIIICKP
jgi:hypothetical protein